MTIDTVKSLTFVGRNGSLEYINGVQYVLDIRIDRDTGMVEIDDVGDYGLLGARRTIPRGGHCAYESLASFLGNWGI